MELMTFFSLVLASVAGVVFWLAAHNSQRHNFYGDTWWLWPLGIYVWGDGLILAPFWLVSALVFNWFSLWQVVRFWLLFWLVRAIYEVNYWIMHQVARREYNPPLFRRWSWLSPNESAILYQLLNMCQVIVCAAALAFTFSVS